MLFVTMAKTEQHKILVQKDKLTSRGILPSSQELYSLMHLTTCDHANQRWKDYWQFCPVCLQPTLEDEDGNMYVLHKTRKDILV